MKAIIEVVEIDEMPKARFFKSNRTSEEKRAEKMSVTASRQALTQKEKEDLEDYMQAKKWGSVSW